MPRAPRSGTVFPEGIYHVIVRGNDRMRVFHDDEDYSAYLQLLIENAARHQIVVYHYVLMPNHVHLLVKPTGGLPDFMHAVQMRYAKRFCRKNTFVGHVWQGRFKSILIDSDGYLFACGNYIEMNPVRARLVQRPQDWVYSSYRAYAFGSPDPLATHDPFYASLGRTIEDRRRIYRESVAATRAVTPVP